MTSSTRSAALRYGSVVVSTVLALLLSLALDPFLETSSFSLFLAAVAFSAWYGGMAPGLLATAIGALASSYFLLEPTMSLTVATLSGALHLLVFALVALLVSSLNANLRAARRAAEAAQARYRNLFEGAADAILVVDEHGHVLDINPAATSLLGYTPGDLRRRPARDLAEELSERMEGAGGSVESWQRELELRRKDGSTVPVEARGSVVDLPEGRGRVIGARDISERRALERMEREFLAMVSHELRNPLASLLGYAQFMQRSQCYDKQAVEVIIGQSRQLDRLIGDLLDVSRLEAGRLELRHASVDLVALARTSAEQARGLSGTHVIRVDAPDRPLVGWWDEGRLAQVLQNLLSNAIKYSPGGEIVLRVQDLGDGAQLAVTDRGVGIASEELPFVFERFYRSSSAAASRIRGIGLGLYISRLLVEAHGGRIRVESQPGRGSTFTLVLPYGALDRGEAALDEGHPQP